MRFRPFIIAFLGPLLAHAQVSNTDVANAMAASVLEEGRELEAQYLLLKAKESAYFGRYSESLQLVKKCLRIDKSITEAQLFAGNLLLREGKGKPALRYYNRALKLGGESVVIYQKMGSAYMVLAKHETAENYFTKAILLSPGHSGSYVLRGEARVETANLDMAIADFSKALDLDQNSASAKRGLGRAYTFMGNYRIALQHLDRAVEMNRTDPLVWHYRGLANFRSFKMLAACEDFTKALELGYRPAKAMMGKTCE